MNTLQKNPHPIALAAHAREREKRESSRPIDLVRRPLRTGLTIIAVFVAGSLGWASTARLAAGAIAPGIISPDGSRRTVQHLEGGIIGKILARDGDEVIAGQTLVVLQDTQAAAMYDLLREQANTLMATRARLLAEQKGNDAIVFPSELVTTGDPRVEAIVSGQVTLFDRRRAAFQAQLDILDDREQQYVEQIRAFEAQVSSAESQIKLIAEELVAKSTMVQQGLAPKPEMLRLDRQRAALEGEHGQHLGAIAEIRQKIGELATQRLSLAADRAAEISTDLEKAREEYAQVAERLGASHDVLERTTIVAPVGGKIVNSRFKTTGGVIRAGDPILDIVPNGERLLIDARVSPSDIDVVRAGLDAVVHLTAYSSRGLPRIGGVVHDVSADRLVDPNTNQSYFLARVEVHKEDLERLGHGYALMPGMPAEVMIVTGERTLLDYFLEPFEAAIRRGLRES